MGEINENRRGLAQVASKVGAGALAVTRAVMVYVPEPEMQSGRCFSRSRPIRPPDTGWAAPFQIFSRRAATAGRS